MKQTEALVNKGFLNSFLVLSLLINIFFVIGNFKNDKQYENWITGQVRSKKIVKVRNGLYVHVDVSGYPLTTKFELATKIAEDALTAVSLAFPIQNLMISFAVGTGVGGTGVGGTGVGVGTGLPSPLFSRKCMERL